MTIPTNDSARPPVTGQITYNSYLKVHDLLALQTPLSRPEHHDETLFIIIHQAYELWFKQILHELTFAEAAMAAGQLMPLLKTLKRITTIQDVLIQQVDILETMTPKEFNNFRDNLNPASGFQSAQFRVLEYRLGFKDESYLKFFRTDPKAEKDLQKALSAPSIYDLFIQFLAKKGFAIDDAATKRDTTTMYQSNESVRDAIVKIYQESDTYYDLYLACEAMIDVDERILLWRYRHVAMVERMIGTRRGTGGSSGVKYLSSTLTKRFFPEIWEARNHLGSGGYGSDDAGAKP